MKLISSALLVIAIGSTVECVRNTPRSPRASRNEASLEFECPEEFGYYPHPRDCTQYYVCVFGGALLESCTGGLMYSHELQTCDWPRNVGCLDGGGGAAKEADDEDDPLLERAAKVESIQLQHQQQQNRHQQPRTEIRHHQRQPTSRQQSPAPTSSSPPVSQITERQSRHRQSQQLQQQQQQQQRIYQDDEYEPATEIESDRQQRVYRGQPSTIGQVQRDRDGLRRNIISVSHQTPSSSSSSSSSSSGHTVTGHSIVSSNYNFVNQGPGRHEAYHNLDQENQYDSDTTTSTPSRGTIRGVIDVDEGSEDPSIDLQDRQTEDKSNEGATRQDFDDGQSTGGQMVGDRSYGRETDSDDLGQVSTTFSTTTGASTSFSQTTLGRSTLEQPKLVNQVGFSSSPASVPGSRRNDEYEKNEILLTTRKDLDGRNLASVTTEYSRISGSKSFQDVGLDGKFGDEFPVSPSSSSGVRSTEEVDRNEISVTPGSAGRGFMVKRLRSDNRVSDRNDDDSVTPSYARYRSTTVLSEQPRRDESRIDEVTAVGSSSTRQRSRNNPTLERFQQRATEKSPMTSDPEETTETQFYPRKTTFIDVDNRKYYLASIPQGHSASDKEIVQISAPTIDKTSFDDSKVTKFRINDGKMKYYVPGSSSRRFSQDSKIQDSTRTTETTKIRDSAITTSLKSFTDDENVIKDTLATTNSQGRVKDEDENSTEDPAKNEIYATVKSLERNFTTPNVVQMARQRVNNYRGQTRHRTTLGNRRSSTLEREKDSHVNSRGQTDGHYRTVSSESPRTVKPTVSTVATVSKAYYSDADQSYPYYTIYDDDVSIYKDEDYGQFTVNRSEQIPQQQHHQQQQQQHHQEQHQQQPNHHQHRQQNVRIAEITPNSNQYNQKTKKVTDSNKYNLSPEVTVSDYDLYDNEPLKNTFRISDDGQSLRSNGLSHPVVHVTTPNAIVDTYVPLTTTTQPPPTTTSRPYTATVQTRGRPQQVNRGTAPPRLRPTLKPSTAIVSKAQEYVDIYRHPAVRPPPIYPTPTVDKPAAKCRKDVCLLPDCSCGGADIPGDFPAENIPQIVLLTFDDSVNDLNKGLYADLFEKGRKNPNGCPISATFYVSHEWTDYSQVQNLYATGHEIASHTVSHSFGEQFSARKWSREIAGQREILAAYGGVKLEDVRGMRAPFLSVGGNNMFKMLWDTNFTYDSSMPIYENRPPSWPYTLDYKLFHDCMIPPCPTRSYPGLWEVPMVMWQDLNGGRCSMGDACSNPPTPDGVYKMLIKNFERHYTTNRAPFGLFYHAAWFTQAHHKEGFISFLDTIVAMDDVWVITNWQALQWMRNPTPLQDINRFEPFGCNYPDRPKKCNNAKVCNLWHKSGVRYMKTCQPCPDVYPWTGKTGIKSSRIDNEIEN